MLLHLGTCGTQQKPWGGTASGRRSLGLWHHGVIKPAPACSAAEAIYHDRKTLLSKPLLTLVSVIHGWIYSWMIQCRKQLLPLSWVWAPTAPHPSRSPLCLYTTFLNPLPKTVHRWFPNKHVISPSHMPTARCLSAPDSPLHSVGPAAPYDTCVPSVFLLWGLTPCTLRPSRLDTGRLSFTLFQIFHFKLLQPAFISGQWITFGSALNAVIFIFSSAPIKYITYCIRFLKML